MSLSGSKTHLFGYAPFGRRAKRKLWGIMVVRVRIAWGSTPRQRGARHGVLVSAFVQGLNLCSAMAVLAAAWRLGNDLNWTTRLAISQGFFSHWQIWMASAILLQLVATILQRHSRGGSAAMS